MPINPLDNPMISTSLEIKTPEDFPKIFELVNGMKVKAKKIIELLKTDIFDPRIFESKDIEVVRAAALKYTNGAHIAVGEDMMCVHLTNEIGFWHLSVSEVNPISGKISKISDEVCKPICLAFLGENYHEMQGFSRKEVRHFLIKES